MSPHPLRTLAPLCTAFLILALSSCKKEGPTPAFIRILSPVAHTDQGVATPHGISDYWVFVNDQAVGVWQADRRIPVLSEGSTNIKIIAGVRRNGVTNDRIQYPFYLTWSQNVDLVLGEETAVYPVFNWPHEPIWAEGGESSGYKFDFDEGDMALTQVSGAENVLVGDHAMSIDLDSAHNFFRAVTQADAFFPMGTDATFLELDHRSDTEFIIGVRYTLGGETQSFPYLYVNPTGSTESGSPWRHVYVDLSTPWGSGTAGRRFYIEAQPTNGRTTGRIILDNLTVHH